MSIPKMELPPLPEVVAVLFQPGSYIGCFPALYDSIPAADAWKPQLHVWTSEAVVPLSAMQDGLPKHTKFPGFHPDNETFV